MMSAITCYKSVYLTLFLDITKSGKFQITYSGPEGSEFAIQATVLPENATDKTLTFESDNTSVAVVDAEGNVQVLGEGTCVITVSTVDGSNLKAQCVITGTSSIHTIFTDADAPVDIYDMNGLLLKHVCYIF